MAEEARVKVDARDLEQVGRQLRGVADDLGRVQQTGERLRQQRRGRGGRDFATGAAAGSLLARGRNVLAAGGAVVIGQIVGDAIVEFSKGRAFTDQIADAITSFVDTITFNRIVREATAEVNRREREQLFRELDARQREADIARRLEEDPAFERRASRAADREFRAQQEAIRALERGSQRQVR